jgi:peptidyl-prolyl cis-trans isomerase D
MNFCTHPIMLKLAVFILLLLPFTNIQAQSVNNESCWKCYQESHNKNHEEALEHCSKAVIATKGKSESAQYSLLKARVQMDMEDYTGAIMTLNKVTNSATFFQSVIYGLQGDCYSELGNLKGAIENYDRAIREDPNDFTTPIYLLKAYRVQNELGEKTLANCYVQTLIALFPEFAGRNQVQKYVTYGSEVTPIPLKFKEIVQPTSLGMGTISGRPVKIEDFVEFHWIAEEDARKAAMQQGIPITPIDENSVWRAFVSENLKDEEFKRLRLDVAEIEIDAYLFGTDGFSVQPDLERSFRDENGNFDPQLLQMRIEEMKASPDPEMRKAWQESKAYFHLKLRNEKYYLLVNGLNYLTDLDISNEIAQEQSYDISFVLKPYNEASSHQFSFNDSVLKEYYEGNIGTGKFSKSEDASRLSLIDFPIAPSANDTSRIVEELQNIKSKFAKSKNDSSFVLLNSDSKSYISGPYSTAVPTNSQWINQWTKQTIITYPESMENTFMTAKVGTVIGPYIQDSTVRIAKVIGQTSENIVARHILLEIDYNDYKYSLLKAQEILAKTTNENFADYARTKSQDQASAIRGGNLGTFYFSQMVQPFAEYCAEAPIGKIGFVETQFGFHIVQVTERSGQKFPRVAIIEKSLKPTDENIVTSKNKAEEFIEKFSFAAEDLSARDKISLFNTLSDESKLFAHEFAVKANDHLIYGIPLESAKNDLLKFLYDENTLPGAIRSTPIYAGDRWFVPLFMYRTTDGQDDEYIYYKEMIVFQLEKDKLEEILALELESMSESEFAGTAQSVTTSLREARIGAIYEPKALGKAFNKFKMGEESVVVVAGSRGVYRVQLKKINEAPDFDITEYKMNKERSMEGSANSEIDRALHKKAEIIDNRKLLELGIRN